VLLLACGLVPAGCRTTPANCLATHNPAKRENAITAYEAQDLTNAPARFASGGHGRSGPAFETGRPAMKRDNPFGVTAMIDTVRT
jgi:hypothetical protein